MTRNIVSPTDLQAIAQSDFLGLSIQFKSNINMWLTIQIQFSNWIANPIQIQSQSNNFWKKDMHTGTQLTPSSNSQLKKWRLCLVCLLIKCCCSHINCDNLRWELRLHFANSCRHVPVPVAVVLNLLGFVDP